jgi:tRNA pseudouridine55 synthase
MDGVLVIDKPPGLTSHDVVAAARRSLGESRIGHTGTLDPLATGVLPLAIGRATRLVRFLTASDKDYDASIRFGLTTDSYDITGAQTSRSDTVPSRDAVLDAIASLSGEYLQTPPAYSAKKVGGRRSYALARTDQAVALAPVPVRVSRAELVAFEDGRARIALTCSAGFYVRAFAHTLGERTGAGACLEALRRTRSGDFTLDEAVVLDRLHDEAATRLIPLDRLLPGFPAATLTERGRTFVSHGRELSATDYQPLGETPATPLPAGTWVRLFDAAGVLIALATRGDAGDSLHPSVVLV